MSTPIIGERSLIAEAPRSARRHDMYHTRLQFAVLGPTRQCGIYSTPAATGTPVQTMVYTGPALRGVLAPQYGADEDEHTLVVLEVPGLPEVRVPLLS